MRPVDPQPNFENSYLPGERYTVCAKMSDRLSQAAWLFGAGSPSAPQSIPLPPPHTRNACSLSLRALRPIPTASSPRENLFRTSV